MSAASQRGRFGESLAVLWLRLKGYRVLARGYVVGRGTGAGEVDIIVRRGGLIAFVEVKARPRLDAAAYAIGPRQRRRIGRAAEAFLAEHPPLARCCFRFDALLVSPGRFPRHICDAWRMDT